MILNKSQRDFCDCADRVAFWSNEKLIREVGVKRLNTVYLGADEGYNGYNGCCYFTEIPVTARELRPVHSRYGLTSACVHLCVNVLNNGNSVLAFCDGKRLSVQFLKAVAAQLVPDRIAQHSDESIKYDSGGRVDCYPLAKGHVLRGIGWQAISSPLDWIIMDAGGYDILEPSSPIHWIIKEKRSKIRVLGLNLPEELTEGATVFRTHVYPPPTDLPPWLNPTQCEKLETLMS